MFCHLEKKDSIWISTSISFARQVTSAFCKPHKIWKSYIQQSFFSDPLPPMMPPPPMFPQQPLPLPPPPLPQPQPPIQQPPTPSVAIREPAPAVPPPPAPFYCNDGSLIHPELVCNGRADCRCESLKKSIMICKDKSDATMAVAYTQVNFSWKKAKIIKTFGKDF